jgi:O-antigen ligase
MFSVQKLDSLIRYMLFAYALVLGFSRGGINTVAILLSILVAVRFIIKPFKVTLDPALKRAFLVLAAAFTLSTIFSSDVTASLTFLAKTVFRILPFFYVLAFIREKADIEKMVLLMAGSVLLGSLVGIWQGLKGLDRVKSFLGIMDFAGILGLVIPFLLVQAFERPAKSYRYLYYLLLAIIILAIMALGFNGTRAVWISVATSLVLYALLNAANNKRLLLFTGGLFSALIAVFYTNARLWTRVSSIFSISASPSNTKRIIMWQYGWETFLNHPFLGVGLATLPTTILPDEPIPPVGTYGHVHSNYIQIMAENGVVGLAAFCLLYGTILLIAWKKMRVPKTRRWATVAFLCTCSFLIHGLFDYTFTIATIMYTYWFIIGLCHAFYSSVK